jgi:hypothetical protein
VDSSDHGSVHTTPELRGHAPLKLDTDAHSHFSLESTRSSTERRSLHEPATTKPASTESPPPFSAHNFPSRYFPARSTSDPYRALATEDSLSPSHPGPAPPFEETETLATSSSAVVADTKADTKSKDKDLDDGEPPPPYTEGSSPLDGFTYVMAAAGSIITQVQQGGPAPLQTALGGLL